jgi:glycyl-tRNA synthetase
MMFKTNVGAIESDESVSYLRPETAQGMFVNFKNVVDTFHPKLPFGLAQIGKAFRNEIAPRDFIFRTREFEQMEIEYFVKPEQWETVFEEFRQQVHAYTNDIGLSPERVHELEVAGEDRAHYSKRTIDFEFDYPFGKKELYGLAYRTDFDLSAHKEHSKVDVSYFDEETKERLVPHCIEPSFGVDRTVLAVLSNAYAEDELGGEKRSFLKLSPKVAPYVFAVFPLLKNKPHLVERARAVYAEIRKALPGRVCFDDNGNIGKRYRRQDEVGTPWCVTVDFETLEGIKEGDNAGALDTVTIRDRDSGEQKRVTIAEVVAMVKSVLE